MIETHTELPHSQPTQVQHRPSESLSRPIGVGVDDPRTTMRSTQQQQQIHREALRLALGSILTPVSRALFERLD